MNTRQVVDGEEVIWDKLKNVLVFEHKKMSNPVHLPIHSDIKTCLYADRMESWGEEILKNFFNSLFSTHTHIHTHTFTIWLKIEVSWIYNLAEC